MFPVPGRPDEIVIKLLQVANVILEIAHVSHLPFRLVSKNPVRKTLAAMVCDEDGVALEVKIVNEFLVFDEALGPPARNYDCRLWAGLEKRHATYLESVCTPERDRVSLFAPEWEYDSVICIPEMIFNHNLPSRLSAGSRLLCARLSRALLCRGAAQERGSERCSVAPVESSYGEFKR